MSRNAKSENGDFISPRSSRAPSFSSERSSMSIGLMIPPSMVVTPPPAYVAVAAASQIVTDQHNASMREQLGLDDHSTPTEDVALFSDDALTLVNSFLDNLLFTFLSTAQSSTLSAIRPAIVEVLKPKLAREAIANADQELQDLLAGEPEDGDEEESLDDDDDDPKPKWELVKVWKRTRLRVMVYTRLGEMEDEDEETYIAQLERQEGETVGKKPSSAQSSLVSWAAAIFLTSVVEYIAEQALNVCGQAAFTRAANKRKKSVSSATDNEPELRPVERVVIEEHDAEKIALNPLLGRLWRTWRKRSRSSAGYTSPMSRRPVGGRYSRGLYHQPSFDESVLSNEEGSRMSMDREPGPIPTETEIAANIPLPMTERDVDEIEVPGLAKEINDDDVDDDGVLTPAVHAPKRPHSSFLPPPSRFYDEEPVASRTSRQRPVSLPPPLRIPYELYRVAEMQDSPTTDFETPMEPTPEEESYVSESDLVKQHGPRERVVPNTDAHGSVFARDTTPQPEAHVVGVSPQSSPRDEDGDEEYDPFRVQSQTAGAPYAKRSSPSYNTRSGSASNTEKYTKNKRSSTYHAAAHDPEEIGVARTSDVPIAAQNLDLLSANMNGSDLQDVPNVEHYLQENDQPAPGDLAPAPLALRKTGSSASDISPISEQFAPRSTSRSVTLSPVHESFPQAELARGHSLTNGKGTRQTSGSLSKDKSRDRSSNNSISSISKSKRQSDEPERAAVQRISSSSQSTSVGSSILNKAGSFDGETRPRGLSGRMSEEDRVKEFDSLVSREETVKYTLTPSSMREMEGRAPMSREPPKPTTKVTVHRQEHPAPDTFTPTSISQQQPRQQPRQQPQQQQSFPRVPSNTRPTPAYPRRFGGPTARDARVQTDSMRDFADFIRSTGPARDTEEVRPILSASPNSKSSIGRRLSASARARSASNNSNATKVNNDGPTARPRVQLEPRGPSSPNEGSGDLIDFIRQGPPSGKSGEHRIARTVAPFRTTMDSDEFNNMYSDRSDHHGTPPESVTSGTTNNSRTGLLPAPKVSQPTYSTSPKQQTSNNRGGGGGGGGGGAAAAVTSSPDSGPTITRTRRRVKDPYAIDYSDDEDEDLLTALPKQTQRQEESLIDFLRNVDPPSQNEPKPIVTAGSIPRRLNDTASSSNGQRVPYDDDPKDVRSPPLSPLAAHPPPANTAARMTRPKQSSATGARDARVVSPRQGATNSETGDLADFLRNSGPPVPPAATQRLPTGAANKNNQKAEWKFWKRRAATEV
ncbi:hypothetical protein EJ05DRAFT_501272 [Pseudovirgaria hyperparasitica]|uniref:Uncharacterized protein n=1 Tax=Pseudovirgaria hyperparasitica TaxID=470096 RepID=A0A6A6W709_9PEZI|nr:uncharacterized protein EJ05DRAFT_501272 [Pseudovirgaria hyperparasitica]KAF2757750.1 hypothetical protein EJ05DRAFT_501272 [Pseudovirgaria hyperparasitica]